MEGKISSCPEGVNPSRHARARARNVRLPHLPAHFLPQPGLRVPIPGSRLRKDRLPALKSSGDHYWGDRRSGAAGNLGSRTGAHSV